MSKRKVFLVTSNDPWEVVALGFAGENLVRTVEWDIGPWVETYGEGEVQLLAKRPVDKNPYPVVVTRDGNSVLWTVRKEDLWYGNELGQAQLFYLMDGQVVARSKAFRTMTREAIEGDVQECSEPERDWVEQVLQSVASAEESAGAAGEASKAAEESARQAVEAEERLQQTIEETAVAAAENAANAAVEKATQVAGTAADSAVESAEDAAGSAGVAGEKAEEAGKSAEAAAKSAEAAGLAEEKAGTYAGQAEESAADAKEQADAAAKSAELANQSAGRAEDAGSQAAESAEAAAGDAADAKESADDAADSALSAAESAEMAQAYSGKPPVITDDIWYVWDAETDAYLSTGKPSRGEQGLTGPQGAAGPKGDTGEAAGFGVPVATVDNNVGVPEVTVSASGSDTAKVFSFAFSGIKGETGAQGPQGAKGEPGAGVGSVVRTAGNGAAGTTDTYTMYNDEGEEIGNFEVYNGANGDGAGDFLANGSVTMTGDLNAGGHRVVSVAPPMMDGDATTKEYVDNTVGNIEIIETASSSVINVSDSAEEKLKGLHLYGKSVQDGIPKPESPVEIRSVGNITTYFFGQNLINPMDNSTWITHNSTIDYLEDGKIKVSGVTATNPRIDYYASLNTLNLLKGKTCIFSTNIESQINLDAKVVRQIIVTTPTETAYHVFANTPIAIGKDATGIRLSLNVNNSSTPLTNSVVFRDIGIYFGDTIQPWDTYRPMQLLTHFISNGLPGIPVDSDGNYTDEDGQQWICDEVDFGRGKHIQRIGKIDHYTNEDVGDVYMSTTGQLSDGATVIYPLETPIETDLPEEVMDAYHQLTMYYPNTTITTDSYPPAGISVEYIADTKTYIDQKYDSLQKQLDILIGADT